MATTRSEATISAIHILLVEDNPADARLTMHALGSARVPLSVSTTRNGEEALAFMRHEVPYQSAAAPDLVLLDLNMPKKDGFEVLQAMRADPLLSIIPVIVLTSSDSDADIVRSYSLRANAYVVKPSELHQYTTVISAVEDFWFRRAQLPTRRV